jgi:hypothetical protein
MFKKFRAALQKIVERLRSFVKQQKNFVSLFHGIAAACRNTKFCIRPSCGYKANINTCTKPVLRGRSRKELHHLVGAGAVTRCGFGSGSDGSGSDNGINHG